MPKVLLTRILMILALVGGLANSGSGQTTAFTYQGRLTDSGTPQGSYQMRFELYDAATAGNQIGATIPNDAVAVTQGVFSVRLDFGAMVFSGGADRFLEIAVRRNSGENYTVLNPRQQINSSPYSIRTLSAQQADLALDSNRLGGVNASEYLTNANPGNSVIRNSEITQTANFNVSGNGTLGGILQANEVRANTGTGFYGLTQKVLQNNSLVLGSIAGQNGATASVSVGIGTPAPKAKLDVTGGNILVGSPGQGIILKSPDGLTCRLLSIDNAGAMVLTAIACP